MAKNARMSIFSGGKTRAKTPVTDLSEPADVLTGAAGPVLEEVDDAADGTDVRAPGGPAGPDEVPEEESPAPEGIEGQEGTQEAEGQEEEPEPEVEPVKKPARKPVRAKPARVKPDYAFEHATRRRRLA